MSKNQKGKLSNQIKEKKNNFYVAQYLYGYDGLDMRKSMIENRKYVKSFIMMLENKNHAQKKRFVFWGHEFGAEKEHRFLLRFLLHMSRLNPRCYKCMPL